LRIAATLSTQMSVESLDERLSQDRQTLVEWRDANAVS
jgi:hypothetical protein